MSDTATGRAAATFPGTRGRRRGYARKDVDEFLGRARAAFETNSDGLSSQEVREVAFPLVRHGYSIEAVDEALGRIEDAFAAREREREVSTRGIGEWVGDARQSAQEVLDRVSRPRGHRFERVGFLRHGYRIDEVDIVADKIADYLATGQSVTVGQVRSVAFRTQRGGYRELQVDAVLDAVIEVMLAVR